MFLERLVNGLSAMNWYQILALLIISSWSICLIICPFAKEKLIIAEQELNNGTKQYAVKHNWFLGLPFLYVTKTEDYGMYEIYAIYDTLKEAEEYVTKCYEKYNKNQERKVKRQRRIK